MNREIHEKEAFLQKTLEFTYFSGGESCKKQACEISREFVEDNSLLNPEKSLVDNF
ncbi:MAG: hypothetical protein HQL10_13135 [Nitrospirae bacterium]|nr:hypothetical protein [Nitrospirota bacterium]